mmetsp:Transcript_28328/g.83869  ORF Transcript_28328/g.83869 Transcript_28328/m.83869 type:complete len:272 (-) Transcript_28328:34-849(-)
MTHAVLMHQEHVVARRRPQQVSQLEVHDRGAHAAAIADKRIEVAIGRGARRPRGREDLAAVLAGLVRQYVGVVAVRAQAHRAVRVAVELQAVPLDALHVLALAQLLRRGVLALVRVLLVRECLHCGVVAGVVIVQVRAPAAQPPPRLLSAQHVVRAGAVVVVARAHPRPAVLAAAQPSEGRIRGPPVQLLFVDGVVCDGVFVAAFFVFVSVGAAEAQLAPCGGGALGMATARMLRMCMRAAIAEPFHRRHLRAWRRARLLRRRDQRVALAG